MTHQLSSSTLTQLPDSISKPVYDRSELSAGILHIGVGNFHRAHQARYLDALFNQGQDYDWAIVGAGIMPYDARQRQSLKSQDCLSTLVEMSSSGLKAYVTGSMIDFCETKAQAIINQISNPNIRIISLTVTEGGYFIDAATRSFDSAHEDIVHDAANIDNPKTVFGIILAGLIARKDLGHPPPTILSCDNIPRNGRTTSEAIIGLARLISKDLEEWIGEHVAFPNSIVDRITPATTADTCAMVIEKFGIQDAAPVTCEPFTQWVMEDHFPLGRPQLELVGAQFVSDIAAYETMKLRILNAGHAAIAYPAALLGYEFVDDALADDDVLAWLRQLISREVIPVLTPIPNIDYSAYLESCIERFKNPRVRDTIARLCQDGSNRQPKFIIPSIDVALEKKSAVSGLALEIAFWCRYCALTDPLDDPRAVALSKAAKNSQQDPASFLSLTDIFGTLGNNQCFTESFTRHVETVWNGSARSALSLYLNTKEI